MSGSIACLSRTVDAHVVATSSVQHITAGGNEMDGSDMKDRLKHRKGGNEMDGSDLVEDQKEEQRRRTHGA
eukprot:scaffold5541_cov63-Cylindrotheca_fusiformis.AAC.2